MNVLLIGSGAREHALAWKLKQSPLLSGLYAIPGSAAISGLAECSAADFNDHAAVYTFAKEKRIDLVVIGPEEPLAKGLADYLTAKGMKVFGPSKDAAQLEASKQFAKEFMARHGLPTAAFTVFYDAAYAKEKIRENKKYPVVIKADGLAAGKGVRICQDEKDALLAIEDFMVRKIFGDSGGKVVMEEFLTGKEASLMALVDGENYLLLPVSRDHKRLNDADQGPNTGGMGAVAPVELSQRDLELARTEVMRAFMAGIKKDRLKFCGVIYAGLMLSKEGPRLLEFNVRFGDPETQCLLPLIESDLLELFFACAEGRLSGKTIEVSKETCLTVVVSAKGYPEAPEKGKEISGLETVPAGVTVFHAGTKKENGKFITSGGRVLSVTATGVDVNQARKKVYAALETIKFEGAHYRKDIGL